jgi:hypothetical protein
MEDVLDDVRLPGFKGQQMSEQRRYTSTVLGHWWQAAALVPGVLVIDAGFTDNRNIAFIALALCVALLGHAVTTIAACADS